MSRSRRHIRGVKSEHGHVAGCAPGYAELHRAVGEECKADATERRRSPRSIVALRRQAGPGTMTPEAISRQPLMRIAKPPTDDVGGHRF